MTFGIIQYVLGQNRFGNAGLLKEPPQNAGRAVGGGLGGLLALAAAFYFFWD